MQISVCQLCVTEIGSIKIGAPQIRLPEIGSTEIDSPQRGGKKASPTQVDSDARRSPGIPFEHAALEPCKLFWICHVAPYAFFVKTPLFSDGYSCRGKNRVHTQPR
ncbi:hypothetical protein KSC_030870 [Ktedonobacter sp. SOSP1-52]|nr:hypothetical protein KSC_030870 [Ktedonobacter sp. SOSP1-52]